MIDVPSSLPDVDDEDVPGSMPPEVPSVGAGCVVGVLDALPPFVSSAEALVVPVSVPVLEGGSMGKQATVKAENTAEATMIAVTLWSFGMRTIYARTYDHRNAVMFTAMQVQ